MLPLQGYLAMNVAAIEGQRVGLDDPLGRPLSGPVEGKFGEAQEQVHEEVLHLPCPPRHWVPIDKERGTEVQPKLQ